MDASARFIAMQQETGGELPKIGFKKKNRLTQGRGNKTRSVSSKPKPGSRASTSVSKQPDTVLKPTAEDYASDDLGYDDASVNGFVGDIDFGAMAQELEEEDDDDFNQVPSTVNGSLGNIDFGAMAQELEDEDDDNEEEDVPAPTPQKRKRPIEEDNLPQHLSVSPSQKKQRTDQQFWDDIEVIDFGATAPEVEEEDTNDAQKFPSALSKKRKLDDDIDDLFEDSSIPPTPKKQARGSRIVTKYCGIQSPSLHDPPLPPKKGGYPAAGSIQYHCPRCNVALSRPDSVRKHFEKCIETNGNPDAVGWIDYRIAARDFEESKKGSKEKSGSKALPTPAPSPEQAAPALASSPVLESSYSPAPSQVTQPTRQPRAQKALTAVCGVQSSALNDPPIKPAQYGSNQSKNRYHCPRCDYALSVPDSVRKHFITCIDKNGNPNALKWTDYYVDALHPETEAATQETSGPISLATAAAKRKRYNDDKEGDDDLTNADGTHPKRQKKAPKAAKPKIAKPVRVKEPKPPPPPPPPMFPTINPHPDFQRTMQPWDRPHPGWMSEIDMCTWQKRPGNTIPLAVELAWNRGEIFSIGKSRWWDPEAGAEKKKKKEEKQAAERKKREEEEAIFERYGVGEVEE